MTERLFVISRAPDPDHERLRPYGTAGEEMGPAGLPSGDTRSFEDDLAERLRAAGARVVVVPHVYYLQPDSPAVRRLVDADCGLTVAAHLHPRAARWTLHALGVGGGESGDIRCLRMGVFPSAEACAEAMCRLAEMPPAEAIGLAVEEIAGKPAPRWYPVLDYPRCVGCGQCREFCLFGVFSLDEERVVASEPDRCKPGCPACARVCRQGAIMFPHHAAEPVIAGAPGDETAYEATDVDEFFGSQDSQAAPALSGVEEADEDLQGLMDALDELDD